jgi:hypothetical protein
MAKAKRRPSETAKKTKRVAMSRPRSSSASSKKTLAKARVSAKARAEKKARAEEKRAKERARRLKALAKEKLSPEAARKQRAAVRRIRHEQRSVAAERGWETRRRKARGWRPKKPKKVRKLSEAEILKRAKARAKAEREALKKPVRKKPVKKKPVKKKPVRKPVKKKPVKKPVKKPERKPVRRKLPPRRKPRRPRAPKKPRPVSKQEKLRRRNESDLVLSYFRDVLHSTCGRMRDEGLVCTVRVHREGDASISGEIVVPVPPPGTKENDVRLLLITLEELDGWSANPAPGKCWVTILFRVDARGAQDQKYPVKIAPGRATYNVGTNYHHLENSAYAFQIGRDEILPGLLEAGRAVIAIVMRVRYMPNGEHPTRPRI